jgi:hypothetical protein
MTLRVARAAALAAALTIFGMTLGTSSALAVTLGFGCISNNLGVDCATGEAQLAVDVIDPGGDQVLFTFTNSGPNASSITDVYFDDGSLLGIASILDNPPDVDFSTPATPSNLPSANNASPPFQTTAMFSADANPPPADKGVNPGESVGILFDLINGKNYAAVLSELASGQLRIGIHVQAFAGGGSESYVNPPLPEPSTGLLIGLGLLAAIVWRRRTPR